MFFFFHKRKIRSLKSKIFIYLFVHKHDESVPDVNHASVRDAVQTDNDNIRLSARRSDIRYRIEDNKTWYSLDDDSSYMDTPSTKVVTKDDVNKIQKLVAASDAPSFVDKLIETIANKKLKDSKVYKAAQVDRRLYSKIISDREYKPSKDTCIALLLALHLNLQEANEMLGCAGYVLSKSITRDVIIEYFFVNAIYDLNIINEILYSMGEKTIGR